MDKGDSTGEIEQRNACRESCRHPDYQPKKSKGLSQDHKPINQIRNLERNVGGGIYMKNWAKPLRGESREENPIRN